MHCNYNPLRTTFPFRLLLTMGNNKAGPLRHSPIRRLLRRYQQSPTLPHLAWRLPFPRNELVESRH